MHKINIPSEMVRTDLFFEQEKSPQNSWEREENGIKIIESSEKNNHYTTIFFEDITDSLNFKNVQDVFIKEFKKYLKPKKEEKYLIIGLGNRKSTPDSLGPLTAEAILVTRYLYLFGEVEDGYSNVASFIPNVMGNTGLDTSHIIQGIMKEIPFDKIIIIDALKTNDFERLGKTIQITDRGISPGSGLDNIHKEISKTTLAKDVIAIGIPTVININTKNSIYKDNFMVTPTNIDFLIERLSLLIGNGINISLHKNFIRQNNS